MTDRLTWVIAAFALVVLLVPISLHFVARTASPPVVEACAIPDGNSRHPGMEIGRAHV